MTASSETVKCDYCHKSGHIAADCRKKKANKERIPEAADRAGPRPKPRADRAHFTHGSVGWIQDENNSDDDVAF
jgi:hypothetical protein